MCGICNVVNCIRRNLFCCNNSRYNNSCYNNSYYSNERYCEPRTNVICANQSDGCFEPCHNDRETRCNRHHHHDCDCGCND